MFHSELQVGVTMLELRTSSSKDPFITVYGWVIPSLLPHRDLSFFHNIYYRQQVMEYKKFKAQYRGQSVKQSVMSEEECKREHKHLIFSLQDRCIQ